MYIYIYIYPPAPCGPPGGRGSFQSQVTVQVYCYRSAVQCPFQVYGSQSSSYWYLFTSFQVLDTCLIATGTAPEHHFTIDFGGILDPMALQSGTLASSKTALLLKKGMPFSTFWQVPWPAQVYPNGTKGIQQVPLKPQGIQNGFQATPKWSPAASEGTQMH